MTDQTEATSFVTELSKCGKRAKHILKAEIFKVMIYEDLRESYTLRTNSVFYLGDRYFVHPSSYQMVIRCLPDEEVFWS